MVYNIYIYNIYIYIYLSYCHISERSPTSARPFFKFRIQPPRFVGAGDMVNGPLIVPTPTPSAWALNGAQAPAGCWLMLG